MATKNAEDKYVIHNKVDDTYWLRGSDCRWVKEAFGASKFKESSSAVRELNSISGCTPATAEVIPYAQVMQIKLPNSNVKQLTKSEADMTFSVLHDCITAFEDIGPMLVFYMDELKKYNEMTQDLLHRIELGSVIGLNGMRLVTKLKEVRQLRRDAKDKIAYLVKVQNTPVIKMGAAMKEFDDHLDTRTYEPRQMPELFNGKEYHGL